MENYNVLPGDGASKMRKGTYAPFLKEGRVLNNNSAERQSGQQQQPSGMSVDEETVIEFYACCFNALDSFSRARVPYKCRVIISVIAATESLACASDRGTYCEQ